MSLAKRASDYAAGQPEQEDRARGLKNVALVGGGVLAGTKLTKMMLKRKGGQGAANLLLRARKGRPAVVKAERVFRPSLFQYTGKAKIS